MDKSESKGTLSSVKVVSSVLFLLSLLLLNGCGFHLKGTHNSAAAADRGGSIYPVYENVSAEFRQIFQQILYENARQTMDVETADVRIVFLKEVCQRRSLTVTDRGIPAEYRLTCTLSYSVNEGQGGSGKGDKAKKHRELSDSSDFKSNNAQLLALESQQFLIKRQIQQRIARSIIRRLQ